MNCVLCRIREACQRHHIWMGHGTKPIADHFNLVANICATCHSLVHTEKEKYQRKLCDILNLDFDQIDFIMKKNTVRWTYEDNQVMLRNKKFMKDTSILDGMEEL